MFPNLLARNRRAHLETRVLALVFLCAAISGAQESSTGASKANARGTCAVSHVGNYDTITITNCGIREEQGKKIEDLLNKILINQDMADVNAKLDQLLKIVSNLGPPKMLVGLPKDLPPSPDGHPRVSIDFYTDRPDEGGQFGVVCDRACTPLGGCQLDGQNSLHIGNLVADPTVAVFLFGRQFPALFLCTLSVESKDKNSIKILGIRHLAITDSRAIKLSPVQPTNCLVSRGSVMC